MDDGDGGEPEESMVAQTIRMNKYVEWWKMKNAIGAFGFSID